MDRKRSYFSQPEHAEVRTVAKRVEEWGEGGGGREVDVTCFKKVLHAQLCFIRNYYAWCLYHCVLNIAHCNNINVLLLC